MTILQQKLPYDIGPRALPGVRPLEGPWLWVDAAYAGQMARRRALIAAQFADVHYLEAAAVPAAQELLDLVLAALPDLGFEQGAQVMCPDGRLVEVDRAAPLRTLGQLVQCDLVLMDKRGPEHVLAGGIVCFPASWTLAEKAGRPLEAIHAPVEEYDANVARRVQRLFDGVQVGRPLWRFNALWYHDPELFQPRSATAPQRERGPNAPYLRSERQVVLRLPKTGVTVFAIHTSVVAAENVPL